MKLRSLIFLLLFGGLGPAFSQPDSILSLPSDRQVLALWLWHRDRLAGKDSSGVMTELKAAERLFVQKDLKILQKQVWLLQQVYRSGRNPDPQKAAMIMVDAADAAVDKGWPLTQAECWHYAGDFYFKAGMYVEGFEYMQNAQHVFARHIGKYQYLLRYADALAGCYYHFGEYRKAVTNLKKTLQLPSCWSSFIYFPSIHNTLGLSYQKLALYDSAAFWYQTSYETAAANKDTFHMALSHGNLGYTYYLQKKYDLALPLLETDYAVSMRSGEPGSATNAAMILAAIYISKGQLQSAKVFLERSGPYVKGSANMGLLKTWYENLYHLSRAEHDYEKAALYADSLLLYKDSVAAMNDRKLFNQTVLKIETEKHMSEVAQLESRRRQQILLRNSLLIGLFLLAVIALLWINRQLLKRNKEKELAEKELEFAQQELTSFMHQLKEKNDVLEQLRNEINKENDIRERSGNINTLLSTTILTEEDWKKFRQLFEKVYPGFFIRLREKMPDLSATDTRLLALTKLQLPPKDMASMLGVSYDAIKKARQRLRKKISLPEEGGLEELVEMI